MRIRFRCSGERCPRRALPACALVLMRGARRHLFGRRQRANHARKGLVQVSTGGGAGSNARGRSRRPPLKHSAGHLQACVWCACWASLTVEHARCLCHFAPNKGRICIYVGSLSPLPSQVVRPFQVVSATDMRAQPSLAASQRGPPSRRRSHFCGLQVFEHESPAPGLSISNML